MELWTLWERSSSAWANRQLSHANSSTHQHSLVSGIDLDTMLKTIRGTRPNNSSHHSILCINSLVNERQDLSSDMLSPGLLVVHDTGRGGEDDLSERSSGEEQIDPVLD
jgi:hypothetical protein